MRFWDSSALVPLLITEERSGELEAVLRADPAMVVWWGTPIECASALSRLEREKRIQADDVAAAMERMRLAAAGWLEVPPSDAVRRHAIRILRVHPLAASDALQLAAAVVAADPEPSALELITTDRRLAIAAEKEGFVVRG